MSVPPATQKPCTLQSTGLSEWNRLMKPRRLRLIICQSTTGSQGCDGIVVGDLLLGELDQVVAAAEALAGAGQRDHVDGRVEVGLLDAVGQLARHRRA